MGQAQQMSWAPPPLETGVALQQCLSWVPRPDVEAALSPSLSWVPPAEGGATSGLHFVSASASRQHPAKASTGIVNADAVMEAPTHLGIADGVSGVHHLGIPPDELPRDLLESCRSKLEAGTAQPRFMDDGTWLTRRVEEAFDATQAYGATTLLIAMLRDSNLVSASLGDCALLVLRPSSFLPLRLRPVFKTEPGRYDSRRPVQVQRLHGFSDANAHTVIQGAMVSTTPVQHGDILILGSDGLFDNLRDDDIQRTVEQSCSAALAGSSLRPAWPEPGTCERQLGMPGPALLQQVARELVDRAIASVKLDRLDDPDSVPWSARGGEVPANNADDTTALVAAVVATPAAARDHEPLESCAGIIDISHSEISVLRDRTNTIACGPRPAQQKPWNGARPRGGSPGGRQAGRKESHSPPQPGGAREARHRGHQCELRNEDCAIA